MTTFRSRKRALEKILLPPAWPEEARAVPAEALGIAGMEYVSALLALLPRGGLLKWRAAVVFGRVTADIALADRDAARTVMRRCMWHMNEDSGNMGWGITEAMGEALAASPALAAEYGRIVLSYVRDTGFADNYVDHAHLRRGAYWAIGRFAPEYPAFMEEGAELLASGLGDEDAGCRGVAAWGAGVLALRGAPGDAAGRAALAALLRHVLLDQEECDVLEGLHRRVEPAAAFASRALAGLSDVAAG